MPLLAGTSISMPLLAGTRRRNPQTRTRGWRRGRDSNPRTSCPAIGFRDRPIRPLWHLSVLGVVRPGCSSLPLSFHPLGRASSRSLPASGRTHRGASQPAAHPSGSCFPAAPRRPRNQLSRSPAQARASMPSTSTRSRAGYSDRPPDFHHRAAPRRESAAPVTTPANLASSATPKQARHGSRVQTNQQSGNRGLRSKAAALRIARISA